MSANSQDLWGMIHAERAALVADLVALEPGAWRHPTLCDEWDVEHVVAHLTAAATVGRFAWLRSVLGARFNFDLHNERRLTEHLGTTPEQTLDNLRGVVGSTTAASGATPAWLGEVIVHSQDIREPLRIATRPDPMAVLEVARFFAGRDFAVPSRSTIRNLRIEATDADFAVGDPGAPQLRGPLLALVMVMARRPAYLAHLEGSATDELTRRLLA